MPFGHSLGSGGDGGGGDDGGDDDDGDRIDGRIAYRDSGYGSATNRTSRSCPSSATAVR